MDYKTTVLLPKTAFPMRGELPKREPHWLKLWEEQALYQRQLKARSGCPTFHLHDGPPFANGDAHMGHALNMTLKDLVLKSKFMSGYQVPFIPGWDCHGLPIEHKVTRELAAGGEGLDPVEIRKRCEAYARKYIDLQRVQFKRLGVFGDWEQPYITMDPGYEADILRLFATLVEKGLVYQAMRPVYWSTGCQTALAEAEVEYVDRTDTSVYAVFPMEAGSIPGVSGPTGLLIWTTTPWTLPANLAVAFHPELNYVAVDWQGRALIMAEARVEALRSASGAPLPIVARMDATTFAKLQYGHPFLPRTGKLFPAEFVTADSGSGLVHIAPGHGHDDYQLGCKYGLDPFSPVDDRGCLTEACGVPEWAGLNVFDANPRVVERLRADGNLVHEERYLHPYPHCWRSKTPIVFRAVTQWFIRVDAFRTEALAAIGQVEWVPSWGENRIRGAVESRPDWCISRQRTWGVPIPVFYDENGRAILKAEVVRRFADVAEQEGTGVWFSTPDDQLAARLGVMGAVRKGLDTLDVWIDSGSSHAAVVRKRLTFPADLYLEGSDQHRGWFQSSLLTSIAATGEAPYKQVLTNGFVVDLDGKKLSKSNTYQKPIDLMSLVDRQGADILRLWVASQDYRDDVPFSEEIFKRVTDTYRSIRNTLRMLLANLDGFDPTDRVEDADLTELDLFILERLQILVKDVRQAYERYEFHQVYHLINRFCAVDLSALYIDVVKDRLYCDRNDSPRRRATQTVMDEVHDVLCRLLAPVIPFTAEEAWQFRGLPSDHQGDPPLRRPSIHLQSFPQPRQLPLPHGFKERWTRFLDLRAKANEALEGLRRDKVIGKSLEAKVTISGAVIDPNDLPILAELFIVSSVESGQASDLLSVEAGKMDGVRCPRCWKIVPKTGANPEHPDLCDRCAEAISTRP
ncbi:MAG: isoleucine--tRNA ligase [Candidatus Methylacidiphilales bacterium]